MWKIFAFHVFTGSDYTAAFNNKGKIRPLQLLETNEDIQDAFASLGTTEKIVNETEAAIERFVCLMYSLPKEVVTVSDARFNHFIKSYKMKKDDFDSIKGCDGSSMPLSLPSSKQKIKRTNKIMGIQKFAHLSYTPNVYHTEENGCHLVDGEYIFNWFEGDKNPPLGDAFPSEENEVEDELFLRQRDSDEESVGDELFQ